MAAQELDDPASGTTSEDYSACYYNEAHLGGYDDYRWENPQWRQFFGMVAERILAATNATTVLDVGCARGLLVQALAEAGADSHGFDVSTHAIESAHADVRARLEVRSATAPIPDRYSLITCIEVLEHLSPADAQLAIDNMCAASDRILFSSSPGDHDEATHINTHPTVEWAQWFAERGFYRRVDVNLGFLSPWAALFEKGDLDLRSLVQRYESLLGPMSLEVHEKRAALLEAHRTISSLHDEVAELEEGGRVPARLADLEREVLAARHDQLTMRDHIIGYEAEAARLASDLAVARQRNNRLRVKVDNLRRKLRRERVAGKRKQAQLTQARKTLRAERNRTAARTRELADLRASRTWRAGRAVAAPFGMFRR